MIKNETNIKRYVSFPLFHLFLITGAGKGRSAKYIEKIMQASNTYDDGNFC